jgi:microcystin-dependent protein
MIEAYLGQIIMGGWNFAPYGTLMCNGQILNVRDNSALFALLGATFGGDGMNTFGLPDMRGRVPMGWGQGANLSSHTLGEKSGSEGVTLTVAQIPAHNHTVNIGSSQAISDIATGRVLATQTKGQNVPEIYTDTTNATTLRADSISSVGGSQPHSNMQPYLCVSFAILTTGIFPSRN